jgi:hypothetical protein
MRNIRGFLLTITAILFFVCLSTDQAHAAPYLYVWVLDLGTTDGFYSGAYTPACLKAAASVFAAEGFVSINTGAQTFVSAVSTDGKWNGMIICRNKGLDLDATLALAADGNSNATAAQTMLLALRDGMQSAFQ